MTAWMIVIVRVMGIALTRELRPTPSSSATAGLGGLEGTATEVSATAGLDIFGTSTNE